MSEKGGRGCLLWDTEVGGSVSPGGSRFGEDKFNLGCGGDSEEAAQGLHPGGMPSLVLAPPQPPRGLASMRRTFWERGSPSLPPGSSRTHPARPAGARVGVAAQSLGTRSGPHEARGTGLHRWAGSRAPGAGGDTGSEESSSQASHRKSRLVKPPFPLL